MSDQPVGPTSKYHWFCDISKNQQQSILILTSFSYDQMKHCAARLIVNVFLKTDHEIFTFFPFMVRYENQLFHDKKSGLFP